MKQDNTHEITRKLLEKSQRMTESALKQSDKLKHPSPRVDKIGSAVGKCAGVALISIGIVQIFMEKPLYALGSISVGSLTLISHAIRQSR